MEKDPRYKIIKLLVSEGDIKSFDDFFKYIPRSVIANDLGINYGRFSLLLNNLEGFRIGDLFRLAGLLEIKESVLLALVLAQYESTKKKDQQ